MTVYFQGAEREDFILSNLAGITHNAGGGYNGTNSRCSMVVAAPNASYWMDTTTFSSSDFWTHFTGQWDGNNVSPVATYTVAWFSGSTPYIGLSFDNSLITLKYWNGSSWSTAMTSNQINPRDTMYTYDVHIKVGSAGVGEIRVYANGVPIVYTNSVDTTFGSTVSNFTKVRFASGSDNGFWGRTFYSEVIVADWNTLGARLQTLVPNAAGNYSQWVGAGYTAVDEITNSSDFMSSNTVDQRFSFGTSNASSLTATESIKGVKVVGTFTKDLTGPQAVDFFTRIGTNDYDGADQTATLTTSSNTCIYQFWANSPATSSEWTLSEVNSAEFGLRSRT